MGEEGGVDVEEDNREGGNHSHHHQRQELQHEVPGCNERIFHFNTQMRIIQNYFLKKFFDVLKIFKFKFLYGSFLK